MYTINDEFKKLEYKDLQIKKILTSDALEILGISLEAGKIFPEHSSPRDAHLIVLEGAIEFNINEKTFLINGLEHFDFPGDTKHTVRALENSRFLIVR